MTIDQIKSMTVEDIARMSLKDKLRTYSLLEICISRLVYSLPAPAVKVQVPYTSLDDMRVYYDRDLSGYDVYNTIMGYEQDFEDNGNVKRVINTWLTLMDEDKHDELDASLELIKHVDMLISSIDPAIKDSKRQYRW